MMKRKYHQTDLISMAEDQSEEFRKFILDNREIIEKILNEGKEEEKKKSRKDEIKENIGERIGETKDKAISTSDAILTVATDSEVQKHFITGCLEFLHFFEAVIKAAPLSPEVREAVEKYQRAGDDTVRNIVSVGAQDRMASIKIDDADPVPKKAAPKKKSGSIPINDLSDASKKKKTE